MNSTAKDAAMSTLYHVDNEVRSKKDSCSAPKKRLRQPTLLSTIKANESKNEYKESEISTPSKNNGLNTNASQFIPDSISTPVNMAESQKVKLHSLSGLGVSPDPGYYSGEKFSPSLLTESESSKPLTLDESIGDIRHLSGPKLSMRHDYGSPDVSKPRKRSLKSQPIFDPTDSPYEFAQKVADNLQRRPNLTMGLIVGGVVILSFLITVYRLNSLQTNQKVQDKSWFPSTVKGRQNGKYASIEYAHEKLKNRMEFKVVDENGNPLGGKKASIQFAHDLRKKNEQATDKILDGTDSNGMAVDNEIINKVTPQNSNKESEEEPNDDEEDYYEAMQLLDDLKRMGDLLQQKSTDSEMLQKNSNVDTKELSGKANEERLRKLKAFENFSTTKLRPLDLGLDNSETISPNEKTSETEDMAVLAKDSLEGIENVEKELPSEIAGLKPDIGVPSKRKRNKSFNKLYNAYSAKVLRLMEKKKNKLQSRTQNQKRSTTEEEDPFRFV